MSLRYILTGTSGSGKTTLLHHLAELEYETVPEAATDVIALAQENGIEKPWESHQFIDNVVALQKERQASISCDSSTIQFYDRSPIDTYALCLFLNKEPSDFLLEELDRIQQNRIYHREVFFLENLGFCEPTEVRRISYKEALLFEKIHKDVYQSYGYDLIMLPNRSVEIRVSKILEVI